MVIAASSAVVVPNVAPRDKQPVTQSPFSTPLIPAVPSLDSAKPVVVVAAVPPAETIVKTTVTASGIPAARDVAGTSGHKQAATSPVVSPTAMGRGKSAPATRKKVLVIGHPVQILDASGKRDRAGVVSRRLSMLGWTVRPSDARRVQPVTTLFYPKKNDFAAKAMQRTLPFPVRLVDAGSEPAMTLVIGQDYLSWKPRNARLASLWQKGITVASLHLSSTKGVRQ